MPFLKNTLAYIRRHFFHDKDDKLILAQWPNYPLWGVLACWGLGFLNLPTPFDSGISQLGQGLLLIWAYLELTEGVNLFRRLLGAVIIAWIVVGYF